MIRLQRVVNKDEEQYGHLAQVFFEFNTDIEKSAVLFHERVDGENYCKVVLASNRRIVYEWSSGGKLGNITIEMEYRLNDGRWHTVNIERNIMEMVVVVDREQMKSIIKQNQRIVKDTSFVVSEVEVYSACFYI